MIRIDCHAHAFLYFRNGFEDRFNADDWVPGPWKEPVQSIGSQVSSLLSPLKGLVGVPLKLSRRWPINSAKKPGSGLPVGW